MRRGPERLVAITPPIVCCRGRPIDRRKVGRFGDDVLAVLGQGRLDLGQRRSGARRDDQLVRRVQRDAGEVAGGERACRLDRPKHAGLGVVADDRKRFARAGGLADDSGDRRLVGWGKLVAQTSAVCCVLPGWPAGDVPRVRDLFMQSSLTCAAVGQHPFLAPARRDRTTMARSRRHHAGLSERSPQAPPWPRRSSA